MTLCTSNDKYFVWNTILSLIYFVLLMQTLYTSSLCIFLCQRGSLPILFIYELLLYDICDRTCLNPEISCGTVFRDIQLFPIGKVSENHIWVLKDGVRSPRRVRNTMPSLTQNTPEPVSLWFELIKRVQPHNYVQYLYYSSNIELLVKY